MTDSDRLDGIIRESLELENSQVTDIAYGVTPTWDSVAHLMLMSAIEEGFGITLDADDVVSMTDYPAIRRTVREQYGLDVGD
jgi:acyl carrier protein